MHMVCAARERAQHAFCVRVPRRLLECVPIDLDGRVCPEYEYLRMRRTNSVCLLEREPLNVCSGLFVLAARLVDVRRKHLKVQADLHKKLAPSR
jgi:hypothetical protein